MADTSDDQLMALFADGDRSALDALFDRHKRSVYGFARTMLRCAADAEDVLQETFLSVVRNAARYEPRGRFRTWILRIARNACLNRIDAGARSPDYRADMDDLSDALCPGVAPPDERAAQDEELGLLRAAVGRLPERQREALALYAVEQMTYRQIGLVMDVPIGTVKTLIHRARAALAHEQGAKP